MTFRINDFVRYASCPSYIRDMGPLVNSYDFDNDFYERFMFQMRFGRLIQRMKMKRDIETREDYLEIILVQNCTCGINNSNFCKEKYKEKFSEASNYLKGKNISFKVYDAYGNFIQ